jgi:hypothetical protein
MFKFLKNLFTIPSAEEIKKESEAKAPPPAPIQPIINQPPATPKEEPIPVLTEEIPKENPAPTPKKKAQPKKATPAKITGAKKAPAKPKKK